MATLRPRVRVLCRAHSDLRETRRVGFELEPRDRRSDGGHPLGHGADREHAGRVAATRGASCALDGLPCPVGDRYRAVLGLLLPSAGDRSRVGRGVS